MFGIPVHEERKPKLKWYYTDNKITGVGASLHYAENEPTIILPYGLSDEQRDVVMWALEVGLNAGQRKGERVAKHTMRQALGLEGGG